MVEMLELYIGKKTKTNAQIRNSPVVLPHVMI